MVTHLFNQSIKAQSVPSQWKLANIMPIPKESPISAMEQSRPLSITDIIIRLFERIICTNELKPIVELAISKDQFAYKKGCNTTIALLLCQHMWMKWLDGYADNVRVFAFDFAKAFDSVNHAILLDKLRQLPINPYVYNWVRDFLTGRQQRISCDGILSPFLPINRGVPQGTILGPVLFSVMVNDIHVNDDSKALLVKYADDITLSTYRIRGNDCSLEEVDNIKIWALDNQMSLNLSKTKELVVRGRSRAPIPPPLPGIDQVDHIKLLGVHFHQCPNNWDLQFDNLLNKAGKRMYILRVCKKYGYSTDCLHYLFHSLIMSLFQYAVSVWACASYSKYLHKIDKLQNRAVRFGYLKYITPINELIKVSDNRLWENAKMSSSHPLASLLPPKRNRTSRSYNHNYILPRIKTERFKNIFINRCLFNYK